MTKNILALLLILLGISHTKAQTTFSLTELQNLCDYSSTDFETYVLKKGYSNDSPIDTVEFYKCDIANSDGEKDIISWKRSSPSPILLFSTTTKEYYLSMKDSLISNGFTHTKKEQQTAESEPFIWNYYLKDNYQVIIYTNVTKVTWYHIIIYKI